MISRPEETAADAKPLYMRVQQSLRDAIRAGTFAPGSLLPSEKELEDEHKVSRITVRRALEELEREGLIERGRGRQARVAALLTAAVNTRIEEELASILQIGRGMEAEVLSYGWRMPTAQVAEALEASADEPVLQVERVRRRRGQAILHTLAHVPAAIGAMLPREALVKSTMLDLLSARGVQPGSVEQEMRAAPCDGDVAALLGLEPGAPVFILDRLVRDGSGRPMQRMIATFRWDSFRYRISSTKLGNGRTLEFEAAGRID
ncbi:GntR family transcriptional regulator [Azospirillum endophyticum]